MTFLLDNVQIATMASGSYDLIPDAVLVVQDCDVAFVGQACDLPGSYADTRRMDCGGRLVTPGLIDCHTHLVYGGNRAREFEQRLEGVSYEEIARGGGGILSTVRSTRALNVDQLVDESRPRMENLLSEGVTTLEIKSGYGLDVDTELRMLEAARRLQEQYKVRIRTTFLGAHALPDEYAGDPDGYIDFVCDQALPAAHEAGLVDAVDAFCEGIGFSNAQVRRVFEAAKTLGLPVKCHAEQLSDLKGAVLASEFGALSADHLEYLDPEDVVHLRNAEVVAVLLPGAYYVLHETRQPPVSAMRAAGVPMAVATDCNPGSSPLVSVLTAMTMSCTSFSLTPAEALSGVTCHAARALGMQEQVGSLVAGKKADLVVWDVEHPSELSYYMGINRCNGVMIDGQWRQAPGFWS